MPPLAKFWYNTSYHSSLGCTPFKVLYGYDPVVAAAPLLPPMDTKSIHDLLVDRNLHIALIKQHLAAAQNRIKLHVDKNRTDREFGVGEQVLLCLQPYAQSSVVNMPYPNISYKFFGPYKAMERIGKTAY
jgi:hypothetical protein